MQSTTHPLPDYSVSSGAMRFFILWTAFFWGLAGLCAVLFFLGHLDFEQSTKASLYGISIWLNGWVVVYFISQNRSADRLALYHECLVIWMLSYAITNVVWEIPWVIFSPFVFEGLNTLDDLNAQTGFMRESILHMYYWSLASFGSVDLRTVNHDPTFFTLEIYSFFNVATTLYFFHLHKKGSKHRYLVPLIGSGEPVASTFIFSFTEVFADFENMPGGIADTLLALVWTQYQYLVFPLIFGYISYKLVLEDWRRAEGLK